MRNPTATIIPALGPAIYDGTFAPVTAVRFTADLVLEPSYGRSADLGRHENVMTLYRNAEGTEGTIVWNYGPTAAEDEEVIGVWFEGMRAVSYDGVFTMPDEAADLLKAAGYDTAEVEFED